MAEMATYVLFTVHTDTDTDDDDNDDTLIFYSIDRKMAGMARMAGMAEGQKEWQNGRMAEVATYVLFMVHADDDDDDTLIFYITDKLIGPTARKSVQGHLLYHL